VSVSLRSPKDAAYPMSNLYDRLDEIQGVTRVLANDVRRLKEQCGPRTPEEIDGDISICRRAYVRAAFALIEALVEQHKRLILDLADRTLVSLGDGVSEQLRKRIPYSSLQKKIRAVYEAAGDAFEKPFDIERTFEGWQVLESAIGIRNRITHPKSYMDCRVGVEDIDAVEKAEDRFRHLHNEFVKVAGKHQATHDWR
jgi:hypothetical protein